MSFIAQSASRRRRLAAASYGEGNRRWRIFAVLGVATVAIGGGIGVAAATTSGNSTSDAAVPRTISCPSVADRLPPAPAAAQAEVEQNLAQLETQIREANARLVSSVGQGGPNFVQNAILGPLADKRRAALDRIRIAYDRRGVTVSGLEALATCTVN